MVSRNCRGFTLVEIVVVIAVLAILIAITLPVWTRAKRSTYKTITMENLHQAWLALELYRQDTDPGSPNVGSSSAMGLPNVDGFYYLRQRLQLQWWQVQGRIGYGPIYYPFDRSDFVPTGNQEQYEWRLQNWIEYSREHESDSVIIGDFNHTEGCGQFPDPYCLFVGYGVRLNGSAVQKTSIGQIWDPTWWDK